MKLRIAPILVPAVLILTSTPACAEGSGWVDQIDFKGDLRLRYAGIDEEFEGNRDRMRFRSRFGFTAKVNDDVKVVLQLATGGDDPVSNNQTVDDGFSTKDIGLDLAYVDWHVNDSLTINVGKVKNPLFRAGGVPLIWDGDLNPEGFAAKFSSGMFFGTVAGFVVEERSSSDDSLLYAVQAGLKFTFGHSNLTAGVGYFAYTGTIGNTPFHNGNAKGNSVDLNGNYLFDYKNTEVFAQFDSKLGNWPLRIFAHFTQNNEVSVEDTAFAYGAKLGSAKQAGSMEFTWMYQDIQADAVIATFNDSDFAGGGSDSDGHLLKAKYGLSEKIWLGGNFFFNNKDRYQGTEHDYFRVQIDLEFKFD
jgi:hypothetical protein